MNQKLKKLLCILLMLFIIVTLASCVKKKEDRPSRAVNPETTKADVTPAPVRDTLTFGHYEQDNDLSNGKEPIEWIVMDKQSDGSLVLMSRYGLDCVPYNTQRVPVAWETCTLRSWLNEEFYNAAFSAEEQLKLMTTTVLNETKPHYMVKGDYESEDKVWILSLDEANSLFGEDAVMLCLPTKYAVAQGANQSEDYAVDGTGVCWWWLRSTGDDSNRASFVNDFGVVGDFGNYVIYDHYTVRPVVRIQP